MATNRTYEDQLRYEEYRDAVNYCPFCRVLTTTINKIYDDSKLDDGLLVIYNLFPYERWDAQKVNSHLLIIPLNHHLYLKDFSEIEKKAYLELMAKYDELGYSIYTRSQVNPGKSQDHYHTHLIHLS